MTGQIDRECVPAMIGIVAALQRPDAVVGGGAVDKDDRRLVGVECASGGVGVYVFVVDRQVHCNPVLVRRIRRGNRLRKDIHYL